MFLQFVFICLIAVVHIQAENCDLKGVSFYEELGCKSVKSETSNCPIKYECPKYELSPKYCNYQGKKYEIGQSIPNELTESTCYVLCTCDNEEHSIKPAEFVCAVYDCLAATENSTCYSTYAINRCCITGNVCAPFPSKKTCKVDGHIYRVGQQFTPRNSCLSCVCGESFQEGTYKTDPAICRRRICTFELYNAQNFADNCAPVYQRLGTAGTEALCCPQHFICDDQNDTIVGGSCGYQDRKCKFGKRTLNYKQSFTRQSESSTMTCSCDLPPYLTCTYMKLN